MLVDHLWSIYRLPHKVQPENAEKITEDGSEAITPKTRLIHLESPFGEPGETPAETPGGTCRIWGPMCYIEAMLYIWYTYDIPT